MDDIDVLQKPSYFNNNIFRGERIGNPVNLKKGLIVDTVIFEGTVAQPIVSSGTVNGLITDGEVRLLYAPADNEYVTYKNWELKGDSPRINFKGSQDSLNHFTFDNLTIEQESTQPLFIDIDPPLGSLIIKNSTLNARNSTGETFNLIFSDNTFGKVRFLNTEVVTASAGNLFNAMADNTNWYFKDCVFDGVNISTNTPNTSKINNMVDGVYVPVP